MFPTGKGLRERPALVWLVAAALLFASWVAGYLMGVRQPLAASGRSSEPSVANSGGLRATAPVAVAQPVGNVEDELAPAAQDAPSVLDAKELQIRVRAILREPGNRRRMQLLEALVSRAGAAGYPALIELGKKFGDAERTEIHCLIAARWAERDPKAAAEFALSEAGYMNSGRIMEEALSAWAASAPEAAIEWVNAQTVSGGRDQMMKQLITAFARRDPEAAFKLLGEQSDGLKAELTYHVGIHWAQRDPQGLALRAQQMPEGTDGDRLISVAVSAWADEDPAAALAWAESLTDEKRRVTAVSSVFGKWASASPEAAQQRELTLPPGVLRDTALAGVARFTSRTNITDTMQLLNQISDPAVREIGFRGVTMDLMFSGKPEAAASVVASFSPGEQRDDLVPLVASRLAEKDVSAALAWTAALPHDRAREKALRNILTHWGREEPEAAVAWMLKNEPPTGDSSGAGGILESWIKRDEKGALTWLQRLPDGRSREMLLTDAIEKVAELNPSRAAGLATASLTGDAQAAAAVRVAKKWGSNDPAAAAGWAAQLSNEAARASACEIVASAWAQHDIPKASAWIDRLPAGQVRDQAVAAFANTVVAADAEGALAWAATITEPARRNAITEKLLQTWITRDTATARLWINSSSTLSSDIRNRVQQFRP